MVILLRNGGEVMMFADGAPITHAHYENEPSWPSRDLARLKEIALRYLPDRKLAIQKMQADDSELKKEDAIWLIEWFGRTGEQNQVKTKSPQRRF